MEKRKSQKTRNNRLSLYSGGTPGFKNSHGRVFGNQGIWPNHLRPQVWRDSSGRGHHSSGASLPEYGSRGDVLRGRWNYPRRWRIWRRWRRHFSVGTTALLLWTLAFTGCKKPEQSLSVQYDKAHLQFQSGELDEALKTAEHGFQQTLSKDPEWNYKFRVL